VEVDAETQEIVVRTSNKKYYKRIAVPDLKICHETLNPKKLVSNT
jgi:hypothetical protein